jgi:nitrogen fixation NifU-like protein
MSSEWDNLQALIKANARKIYSGAVVDHAASPRNIGMIQDADGFARIDGTCGDAMEVWLKISHDTINDIKFMTDGCGTSIASGSMMTELAKGKTTSEALKISQQEILDALGGLPEENRHCAILAANTLKAAIRDYIEMKNHPWKKAYRKY